MGEISLAMLSMAAQQPGTVRDLAMRAQVGYDVARYTATRLVERGQLVRVADQRPAVLGVAPPQPPGGESLGLALQQLSRSFWESDGDDDSGPCSLTPEAFACL
jgi:hypothetical protein